MDLKALFGVAAVLAIGISTNAWSQERRQPYSHPEFVQTGALICDTFAGIQDGTAALRVEDRNWLTSVGCATAGWPIAFTSIDTRLPNSGPIRVRLHLPTGGRTVYIHSRDYYVWLKFSGVKDPKALEKTIADFKAKDPEAFKFVDSDTHYYQTTAEFFYGPAYRNVALNLCWDLEKRVKPKCFPTWGTAPGPEPTK